MFASLYDRVLGWSGHRHAPRYLVGLSFAEATFFPVPPDVMLAPMVLASRARAWRLAGLTTLASVAGGLVGYLIGWFGLELVWPLIVATGQEAAYHRAVQAFEEFGLLFVIIAGFTPIPFKLITLSAGALHMPLLPFVVGSLIGRAARFYLVAAIVWAGGERAAEHLRKRIDAIGWTVVALVATGGLVWWLW
ncbi:MAG: YqaA family protein [Wenzhouxiangellaceae bacterium]